MRLRVFLEPQLGATYEQQLAVARRAEEIGFDALFRSDHYLTMGGRDGMPGPTDSWVTLAGIARETSRIRLGTLLSSATFRLPGTLAIQVAQVDEMSGGRVELGLGAGWYREEHTASGIPFPSTRERFARLEEQLAIVTGLWTTPPGEDFDFEGEHYRLAGSPALPKPIQQPRPPVIVGGTGLQTTPRLAALWANELNVPFCKPVDVRIRFEALDRACEEVGKDPSSVGRSAAVVICCGSDASQVRWRAERTGQSVDELSINGACGSPEQVADRLGEWADAGAETVYLQFLDITDLEHVSLVGEEVMPGIT